MAEILGSAVDWTFDLYMEDVRRYETKQITDAVSAMTDYRGYFIKHLQESAKKYRAKWMGSHTSVYDKFDGYVGDAFAGTLYKGAFSDFYKDAYGQRPHLPIWYYVHPLGLPMQEDTARTFCADPIAEAEEDARLTRKGAQV